MESKNTFILHETEAFMRGELDNVTVAHGRIVLDLVSGGHVPYGCYTSPAVPLPTFDALRVSWNAGTPPGTAVEAQARVTGPAGPALAAGAPIWSAKAQPP